MVKIVRVSVAAVVAGMLLSGSACAPNPALSDRGGVEGALPDLIGDVDHVTSFRNVDGVPNIARVCIDGVAFAASSSLRAQGEGGSAGGGNFVPIPAWDVYCATVPKAPAPHPPTPAELGQDEG